MKSMFPRRNLDARLLPVPRDLALLLVRLAHARLNVGTGDGQASHP
jgi:hypothetical protein